MDLRVCMPLIMFGLAGCVSASPSATSALGPGSEAKLTSVAVEGRSAEALVSEADNQHRTKQPLLMRRVLGTSHAVGPAPDARTRASVRVASAAPDESLRASSPAVAADERERLARSMEERHRRWDGAAQRAIRSICSGC